MHGYLGIALWIVGLAAWMVGFWAITEAMKKTRAEGHSSWSINPLGMRHMIRSREFVVFLASGVVVAAVGLTVFAFRWL
jgi:hypothetical protein